MTEEYDSNCDFDNCEYEELCIASRENRVEGNCIIKSILIRLKKLEKALDDKS